MSGLAEALDHSEGPRTGAGPAEAHCMGLEWGWEAALEPRLLGVCGIGPEPIVLNPRFRDAWGCGHLSPTSALPRGLIPMCLEGWSRPRPKDHACTHCSAEALFTGKSVPWWLRPPPARWPQLVAQVLGPLLVIALSQGVVLCVMVVASIRGSPHSKPMSEMPRRV